MQEQYLHWWLSMGIRVMRLASHFLSKGATRGFGHAYKVGKGVGVITVPTVCNMACRITD